MSMCLYIVQVSSFQFQPFYFYIYCSFDVTDSVFRTTSYLSPSTLQAVSSIFSVNSFNLSPLPKSPPHANSVLTAAAMIASAAFQTLTLTILLLLRSISAACIRSCHAPNFPTNHVHVPYPFGFSPSCSIQLNCTSDGTISLHHFPIRTLSSDSLLVNLEAKCNRPITTFQSFFGSNYAPISSNGILLKNCSRPATPCKLPSTAVQTNFELYDCGGVNSSVSCYSEYGTETRFLSYEKVLESECRFLFSSISVATVNVSEISLDVQVVQIGWWIEGDCRCSENADCIHILSPVTRQGAHRCRCREGFVGDGFLDGEGCREEKQDCSASRFLMGKCGGTSRWVPLFGGIAAGILLMVCVGLFFCFIRRRSSLQTQRSTNKLITEASGGIKIPIYPYKEIEKATCGFSDKQMLGTGANGTVYSAKLSNEERVAIKRIKRTDTGSIEKVMNEIKLISAVSHPNLVRLLGCSIEKGEQLLVYEYMPNGTLAEQLQGTRGQGLPWATRLNIANETARAISYLHSHDPPIFHRDIKSSNILLDYNLKSKVADFGLSRLGEIEFSHISTAPQGTPGYLDPQYHQNFQLSDKSDVYSFGVVLVEIITGLKVVDFSRPQDEVNLAALASDRIVKGHLDDIIDRFLIDAQSDPWTLSSIHRVAELAFRCLTYHRDMRPTMTEVSEELEQIRIAKFLESEERHLSMSTSNLSSSSSSSNQCLEHLHLVIKNIAIQNNRPFTRCKTNSINLESPISPQDSWPSDQGSPSASSLLNNVIH
ncbi:unnamed protein product [Rhodiola kirilowii]